MLVAHGCSGAGLPAARGCPLKAELKSAALDEKAFLSLPSKSFGGNSEVLLRGNTGKAKYRELHLQKLSSKKKKKEPEGGCVQGNCFLPSH